MVEALRNFVREIIQEELQVIDRDERWSSPFITYLMSLRKDRFIHFTTVLRAEKILESKKLLMHSPYEKFGTDTVDAVSVKWGSLVPGVQFTHIMKRSAKTGEGPIVAILFKTDVLPKYGYSEEVKWDRDVNLINPQVVSFERGINMLKSTPYQPEESVDFVVKYKK